MNFENFKKVIAEKIIGIVNADFTVELTDVTKNNGTMICGLTIQNPESNIAPVIYLNDYYDMYKAGKCELEEVVNNILWIYSTHRMEKPVNVSIFTDYNRCKSTLACKLVNTEKNKGLLRHVPHVNFFDLSIVFVSVLSEKHSSRASVLIRNDHLQLWGITQGTLAKDAFHNAPLIDEYKIISLSDLLPNMPGISKSDSNFPPLFSLSNKEGINGAACMLYPGVLKSFSEKAKRNLYIIPSSVNEVLLLPESSGMNAAAIREIIQQVNDTQVEEEDILSYSVYYYDRNEDMITMPE